jgi:hypothetical protein
MHLKPNTRAEFTQTIENEIVPLLKKQYGFRDEIVFVAPGSGTEAVAISLWDKKEDGSLSPRQLSRCAEGPGEGGRRYS